MNETKLRDLAAAVRAVQRGMKEITATADSPDGLISATVDARGELLELRLDPRVYREPNSRALAKDITDTTRLAAASARRQLFELSKVFLPAAANPDEVDLDVDPFLSTIESPGGSWR